MSFTKLTSKAKLSPAAITSWFGRTAYQAGRVVLTLKAIAPELSFDTLRTVLQSATRESSKVSADVGLIVNDISGLQLAKDQRRYTSFSFLHEIPF